MRKYLLLFALLYSWTPTANAQPAAPVIDAIVSDIVIGGYTSAHALAGKNLEKIQSLCESPSTAAIADARASFAALVVAWSRIEMIRFGPARSDNRFERLFFWPDRRGRGRKQVMALVAKTRTGPLALENLRQKSVAVQGLTALERVLYAKDSARFAKPANTLCPLAREIARSIETTLGEIVEGWSGDDGYGAIMKKPGPQNPVYRSEAEVWQEILRAASEQIQIVRNLKIGSVISDTPAKARPKRAPFWVSGLTLVTLDANLDAVARLFSNTKFEAALPQDQTWLVESLGFEIDQAREVIRELMQAGRPWIDESGVALVKHAEVHRRLVYSQIPLAGSLDVLTEGMPEALGLTLGFNSLDGD